MKICVTGHRQNKMPPDYGYDMPNPKWANLRDRLKSLLIDNKCEERISGMALGADTIFCLAILDLKEDGYFRGMQ